MGGLISLPFGNSWLNHYLAPLFSEAHHAEHHLGTTEYTLMAIAVAGGLIGIGLAYNKYLKGGYVPKEDKDIDGFAKTVYNKYYVDEAYMALIVKPINGLSNFFRETLEPALSRLVYSLGTLANGLGSLGSRVQNGSIGLYLSAFVIGFSAIFIYLFLANK